MRTCLDCQEIQFGTDFPHHMTEKPGVHKKKGIVIPFFSDLLKALTKKLRIGLDIRILILRG